MASPLPHSWLIASARYSFVSARYSLLRLSLPTPASLLHTFTLVTCCFAHCLCCAAPCPARCFLFSARYSLPPLPAALRAPYSPAPDRCLVSSCSICRISGRMMRRMASVTAPVEPGSAKIIFSLAAPAAARLRTDRVPMSSAKLR